MKALLSALARSLLASPSATAQLSPRGRPVSTVRAFLASGAREGVVELDGKEYTIEFVPKAKK